MTTTSQSSEFASDETQQGHRLFSLKTFLFVLVIIGIGISGYLSYVKFTAEPMVCITNGPFDCNVVQNSLYSEFLGVPVAYFGLATYLLLGALLMLENRIGILRTDGRLIFFGISLFGWIYSMWLVYVQVAILEALCPWCLAHEVNFTVLFGVAIARLIGEMRQS
jgi:uncharacterized membrane protein